MQACRQARRPVFSGRWGLALEGAGALRHQYPLPLHHSWPLFERARHFDLGWVERAGVRPPALPPAAADADALERAGIGTWECDLADDSLTWSPTVHDLFGLPRGAPVARADAVARYGEGSRAAMERLRAHAIAHRRGFTLDVEIWSAPARSDWVRLIAAPICVGDQVVGLHGLKCRIPG